VQSVTQSPGRIIVTLIDQQKPLYIEVALPRDQISSIDQGNQVVFTQNGIQKNGTYQGILTDVSRTMRVGISENHWNNQKNVVAKILPDETLEWDPKLIGQPVRLLFVEGRIANLWTGFKMALKSL